jgi:hypothetical protein
MKITDVFLSTSRMASSREFIRATGSLRDFWNRLSVSVEHLMVWQQGTGYEKYEQSQNSVYRLSAFL